MPSECKNILNVSNKNCNITKRHDKRLRCRCLHSSLGLMSSLVILKIFCKPMLAQRSISIPPENVRKPGGTGMEHGSKMG